MKWSYSRVGLWEQCPFKFKCRYIDKLEVEEDLSPTAPLILGSAMDEGIQSGIDAGIDYYYNKFPKITDVHVSEAMKIEYWIPKVHDLLSPGGRFQVEIESDDFKGYADYINSGTLIDFKYSSNTQNYEVSKQLSLYKSELEEPINYMAYMCIPKTFIRQKNSEDVIQFRNRLRQQLATMKIAIVEHTYDPVAVNTFWDNVEKIKADTEYKATKNEYCKYCEYSQYCPLQKY